MTQSSSHCEAKGVSALWLESQEQGRGTEVPGDDVSVRCFSAPSRLLAYKPEPFADVPILGPLFPDWPEAFTAADEYLGPESIDRLQGLGEYMAEVRALRQKRRSGEADG